MTTLTTSAVSTVIEKVFAESDAGRTTLQAQLSDLSDDERARLRSSSTDYKPFYTLMKDAPLAVSRETATLLYMLTRATRARSVIEFGTSFGISTIYLAAALRDNGGGRVITTEFEPSKVARARANIAAAGHSDLVEIREGDAIETLARDLPESIDLVLLDGAKGLYPKILALLEERLRPGALVVADNADWSEEYLARVRAPSGRYQSVPFAADVELTMRV
jgi:predicted O-methyltransferase YrrM